MYEIHALPARYMYTVYLPRMYAVVAKKANDGNARGNAPAEGSLPPPPLSLSLSLPLRCTRLNLIARPRESYIG